MLGIDLSGLTSRGPLCHSQIIICAPFFFQSFQIFFIDEEEKGYGGPKLREAGNSQQSGGSEFRISEK